ncbi:MAG: hypothetical protein OFPII_40440 [Osedax symbiont Rs1]|nr:MAG: hypothetical protein OFPII_40440 [Osedax symbiont Rs1]
MKIQNIIGALLYLVTTTLCAQSLSIAQLKGAPDDILGAKLLKEIYKRANIQLELTILPAKRALIQSSQGIIDGELQRIFVLADKFPTLIRIPTPFTYFEPTAFSKNTPLKITGWSALDGYRIGIVRGMKFAELGLQGIDNVYSVTGSAQLFNMLEKNRLDIVVTGRFNGLYYINNEKIDSIQALKPALERHQLYHYLHQKHKNLVPQIDAVIKSMLESGELAALRIKYVNELLER